MALLRRWDPFSELNSLHEQVNELFNQSLGDMHSSDSAAPATDVYSDDKGLTIETQLPNFKEDEISIEQHEGELAIKAEHEEKEESKDRKYLIRESVSRYYRRFALPRSSDTEKIDASFENGVLRITVPYKELPQPKKIAISAKSKTGKK